MRVEGRAEPRKLDKVLDHRDGSLHRVQGTREYHTVPPEDDADSEELMELLEMAVVHSGEKKVIDTFVEKA